MVDRRGMVSAPKLMPGDRVAVLSPSFAAPGFAPAIHAQAMERLAESTGLVPVEFPTTRTLGASAEERAADVNAAFADPSIRAILATIGGDDQITVVPHLTGAELEIVEPGESEDFGLDWHDPRALREFGEREPTEPWTWAGAARRVTGVTWGGCLEAIDWLALAGRLPAPEDLENAILLLETSEVLPPADWVRWWLRALGERGILDAVAGVLVARPPTSNFDTRPDPDARAQLRAAQRDAVIDVVTRYNPDAVMCLGVPFGHTRPQWILPYGGSVTIDGTTRTITADYA